MEIENEFWTRALKPVFLRIAESRDLVKITAREPVKVFGPGRPKMANPRSTQISGIRIHPQTRTVLKAAAEQRQSRWLTACSAAIEFAARLAVGFPSDPVWYLKRCELQSEANFTLDLDAHFTNAATVPMPDSQLLPFILEDFARCLAYMTAGGMSRRDVVDAARDCIDEIERLGGGK